MSQEKFLIKKESIPEFIDHIKKFKELSAFYDEDDKSSLYYKYYVDGEYFYVYDSNKFKITSNCGNYNCSFSKKTGETIKFGTTLEEDPVMCKLGPEIMDLEISVNGCPKVGGHNCKFCYKNNSDAPATNMSFDTFKKIVDSFPKSLNQIAFGITGVQTNPDFPKMLNYCRNFLGIIPNYTLSGADLTDDLIEITKDTCGAVAVSCYEGNKELCYNTIDRFAKLAPNVHVNMHIVLSKGTLNHVMDVLNDLKHTKTIETMVKAGKIQFKLNRKVPEDPRLRNLRHIVFLRIKPVGRASKMDTTIPLDVFEQVMKFCNDNGIGYGFDSCTAPDVERVLRKWGKDDQCQSCESCESGRFSAYCNVSGQYWHCSFAERDPRIFPIDLTKYESAITWWNSKELNDMRQKLNLRNEMDCPLFKLTAD